ncbi:phage tail tape measure protein [Peribacillus frigoritolerans]|uniref:phage tail tape measure protein n=1 Tax=Peribacillus frigoritolerans TaxID=450367 RepID=UPI0033150429
MMGVTKAFAAAGAAIATSMAAIGGAALKAAVDFDNATSTMQVRLGMTSEEAEKFAKLGQTIWQDGWGENINEVTTNIAKVQQYMQDLNETDMNAIVEGAYTIQEAFGIEVGETIKATSVLMKNFNVSSTEAMDLYMAALQKGGDYSDEFMDSVREYSPQFAAMGISAEQMFEMFITGAQAGAWNLDKIADAVKEFNIRAQDGSKLTAESFQAIGLDAQKMGADIAAGGTKGEAAFQATVMALSKMEDDVARNQVGVGLFGTQWEDVRKEVILALGQADGSLGKFEGSMKQAQKTLEEGFGKKMTQVWRDIQAALIPLGLTLLSVAQDNMPRIQEATKKMGEELAKVDWQSMIDRAVDFAKNVVPPIVKALGDIVKFFANMDESTAKFTLAFAGIAAVIGPIALVLSSVINVFGALFGVLGKLGGPLAKIGGWFMKLMPLVKGIGVFFAGISAPVWGVIAAIAGVIAIGVLLWKNWDKVKEVGAKVWDSVSEAVSGAMDSASGAVNSAVAWISESWDSLVQMATNFGTMVSNAWKTCVDGILLAFQWMKDTATALWTGIVNGILALITPFITFALNLFTSMKTGISTIFGGLADYFTGIWTVIKNIFLGSILLLIDLFTGNFGAMKEHALGIFENIKNGLSLAWEGIKNVFSGAIQVLVGFITTFATSVWSGMVNLFTKLSTTVSEGMTAIKNFFISAFNLVLSTVVNWAITTYNRFMKFVSDAKSLFDGLRTALPDIWNRTKAAIASVISNLVSEAISKITGMVTSIGNKANEIRGKISSAWESAKSFLSSIDLYATGRSIIQGLINGIGSLANAVADKVRGIVDGIKSKIENALNLGSAKSKSVNVSANMMPMSLSSISPYMPQSGVSGMSTVNNTTNFQPSINITTNDPFQAASVMNRQIRRMAFEGGISR